MVLISGRIPDYDDQVGRPKKVALQIARELTDAPEQQNPEIDADNGLTKKDTCCCVHVHPPVSDHIFG
jgi:hypothetical protein